MSDDERRLAAGRALFAKVLAEVAASEVKKARKLVEPTMVPGERVKGVLPDGRVVGDVVLSEQPVTAVVTDEKALLEYVRRTRPDEVLTREYVRESFLAYLLDMAKSQLVDDTYDGDVVDAQGEVVPGIALDYGTPRYIPKPTAAGRRAIHTTMRRLFGSDASAALEIGDDE